MPRLWIFSDTHLDRSVNRRDATFDVPRSGFDVVIVAGDAHSPLTAAIDWLADTFPGIGVIYVPGNHDFWSPSTEGAFTHDDMLSRGRDLAARRGIHLLSNDTIILGGVRYCGATLWTDMVLGSRSTMHAHATARRSMNDYRNIRRYPSGHRRHIRVADTVGMHVASRDYIDGVLAIPHDGPTVVVSHHAPHSGSLPDPYFDLRWAYASDMSDLILARHPDLWVHGHIHQHVDYMVGQTRIVANPRGHHEEWVTSFFVPAFVIDLASPGDANWISSCPTTTSPARSPATTP